MGWVEMYQVSAFLVDTGWIVGQCSAVSSKTKGDTITGQEALTQQNPTHLASSEWEIGWLLFQGFQKTSTQDI